MHSYREIMDYLREINLLSIFFRLTLATICAGIIGHERGKKKQPAGFRTHIVVCIGATMVMLTSQYMTDVLGYAGDPARLGAQVISGIGFLGAGTIIVIGRNQVKGLTTAAGLWACACMGLAIGIGFYEAAVIACVYILGVVTVLHKIDLYARTHTKILEVHMQIKNSGCMERVIRKITKDGTKISNIEVSKSSEGNETVDLYMTLTLAKKLTDHSQYIIKLNSFEDVIAAEEDS